MQPARVAVRDIKGLCRLCLWEKEDASQLGQRWEPRSDSGEEVNGKIVLTEFRETRNEIC